MMRRLLLALTVAALCSTPALAGPIYNATADFGNPQAAPWSYGYSSGLPAGSGFSVFTSFTTSYLATPGLNGWYTTVPTSTHQLPAVLKNATASTLAYATVVHPVGVLNLHPSLATTGGASEFAIVRFTAPETSFYDIDAFFQGLEPRPTTTDVHIYLLLNGQLAGAINSYGPAGRIDYSSTLSMSQGDTLDFAVGPGAGGFYYDSTGFDATITAVPEPATLSLLGLGVAGIARAARRRKR